MTRSKLLIPASLTLALFAGAGAAQNASPAPDNTGSNPGMAPNPAVAAPVPLAGGETSAQTGNYNPTPTTVTPQTAPPAQVQALAAGDNTLVTNGPVPDTAANRARYGKPLSHAGRQSPPNGN